MIPSQSYCSSGIVTLYIFFLVSFVLHTLASDPTLHYCHHEQRDALLEFKHEFPIYDTSLSSWNKSNGCCSWEGVTCDAKSGEVTSLVLDSISLNKSLEPNSGLFKLQHLVNLTLRNCSLYGEIPFSLGNLSSLSLLDLSYNNLVGQLPASIGKLSRLSLLDFRSNNLVGQLPASVGNLTQLRYISLANNKLNGNLPVSFANLTKLSQIDLYNNNFSSTLPPDMSGFHYLDFVNVGENSFSGPFPTSLFKNPSLEWVNLGGNQFKGPIEFKNISSSSKLENLYLSNNQFDGHIPESLYEFLSLKELSLSNNNFIGPFPTSLFTIPLISLIDLGRNQFKGPIEFGNISSSSRIRYLILAQNKLDGPIPESLTEFLDLQVLDLSYNNLTGSIPRSISKLVNLNFFHLYNNKLVGQVPGYLWGLMTVKFSHNSFSSIEESSKVFDETNMVELDLSSNSFQGPFPHWICKLRSLRVLDLSSNNFSGSIPQCLRNSTVSLEELILRDNNFDGTLPDIFFNATNLKTLDVSANQLVGKLPKSLINCKAMQLVNVQSNGFKDKFPSCLGSLPSLNVLLLRKNQFYGPLYHHNVSIGFQTLRVIDVSHNDFIGTLPSFYFSGWREMTILTKEYDDDTYMETFLYAGGVYPNSMEIVHKGVETQFERIRQDFRAIDLSGNRLYGNIPESIGLLKQVRLLNLSGNAFTGNIPQSLANLANLEALDLSRNQLSGRIPLYFGSLSFLSIMNFSSNNLEGPVPRGTQFQSQNCSSFMDNPKLYGLEEICGKNSTPRESEELWEPAEEQVINWIAAAIAYGPGVFCGLVIGHIFASHKREWFIEKFRRNEPRVVTLGAR